MLLLILLRNSTFFPMKIFLLIFWNHFVKQTIFLKKWFSVWTLHFNNFVSGICPTRFTSHRKSWQTGKIYLFLRPGFFSRYYFGRYSPELPELVLLSYFSGWSTHHSDSLHDFSVNIHRCQKDVYVNSLFSSTITAPG